MKIGIQTKEELMLVHPEEIIWINSDSNYTRVYLTNSRPTIMTAKCLSEYDKVLKPLGFIRVNRSSLVNITHITSVNAGVVRGVGNLILLVPRSRRVEVREEINKHIILT